MKQKVLRLNPIPWTRRKALVASVWRTLWNPASAVCIRKYTDLQWGWGRASESHCQSYLSMWRQSARAWLVKQEEPNKLEEIINYDAQFRSYAANTLILPSLHPSSEKELKRDQPILLHSFTYCLLLLFYISKKKFKEIKSSESLRKTHWYCA